MRSRDPHQALDTKTIGSVASRTTRFDLVKLRWGKDDSAFSLHAEPRVFSTAGLQTTDLLRLLGFTRSRCAFVERPECYVRWVDKRFNLDSLIAGFDDAYEHLRQAESHLQSCGYFLDQPEGWGYFTGQPPGVQEKPFNARNHPDGHTTATKEVMKSTEDDETFDFKFSWIKSDDFQKGWTIHYRPKHPPLSSELSGVFRF